MATVTKKISKIIKGKVESLRPSAFKIKVVIYFVLTFFQRVRLFTLKKIFPITKKVFVLFVFTIVFVVVALVTLKGLKQPLTDGYKDLFGVLTSTIGTIVAIFFSLILIPLNQIATKYSTKFLKYLKKDRFFIFVILFSIFILVYDVVFLFTGASQPIAIAAIILFVFLIVLLILSMLHIMKLSDPYNSILLPAHNEITKTLHKSIKRYRKEYEKSIDSILQDNEELKKSTGIYSFKVDTRVTDYIQESLLPIREVAIKAIRDLDLGQAKNAIQTMMSVVVHYLNARKEYYSDDDPILYFLYTEYRLITQAASNELKIRLHPFIVDCWREVGIYAAVVNIKGMKRIGEGSNALVVFPIKGLKELCALNLLEMDSYAPGKACEAMADIGVQLMNEGYDLQASAIVEELANISIVADQHGIKNVSGSANHAIMRIYAAGVSCRNSGGKDSLNYAYRQINKYIDLLLGTFLQKKRNAFDNMILSPFIGWLLDPFTSLNLSRISEYGIFSPDLNKFSIERNLECVRANIKSLKLAIKLLAQYKDWFFINQSLENIYRIVLNLLSYLNPPMAKDHVLLYSKQPLSDPDLFKKSTDVIIDALNEFYELIIGRADKYIFENDHIHIFFSLYLIILYEHKIRQNSSLQIVFEKTHEALLNLLNEYKKSPDSDSNDDLYKYYRLLIVMLNENNFKDLASMFDVPEFEYRSQGMIIGHERQYPETMFNGNWILKRPGFQVNGYYYNDVESALKLDKLKFY